jgi:hypothetical protein
MPMGTLTNSNGKAVIVEGKAFIVEDLMGPDSEIIVFQKN